MATWFGPSIEQPFIAFGTSHYIMLGIYFIGIILMFVYYKKILIRPRLNQTIRWVFFSLLIISEISYQFWAVINGVWNFSDRMPLHLCGIASLIAMYALLTYKERAIQIAFFIGIIPSFLALVTPDIPHDYEHFRFWKFFIHHIVISWSSLYLILTSNAKITFRSVIVCYGYLVGYAIIVGVFINPAFDSNYLYLSNTPSSASPLDLFGTGFWYIINLSLVALAVFMLLYAAYKLSEKLQQKEHSDNSSFYF